MTPSIVVFVGPDHDLSHTSLVLTGFCALAARGDIALRYQQPKGDDRWLAGDPTVVCFEVEGKRVAIDLRDGEGISQPIIDRVTLYFKRAFSHAELERRSAEHAARIRAFGLNFPCRSVASTTRLMATLGVPLVTDGVRGLRRLRAYLATPPPPAFEQGPEVSVEPRVVFQTRVWSEAEVPPGEMAPLNEGRVEMVRALRRAFGDRFIGGLVPTAVAVERYPDEVTTHASAQKAYLRLKKGCLIQVYTPGIEQSLAFKLGEALAASQCLVATPFRQDLPTPLEAGRHYLPFETTDQCIEACQRLFDQPALARAMRQANHEYYVREVEPAAHIARVLARLE